jgi:catechol 2,3-dioxygenase-like lactoylglutathione lyase family enzyme
MATARRTALAEASSFAAVFDHVTIRVSDRLASERFYTTVLGVLGLEPRNGEQFDEWGDFSLAAADDEFPLTRGLHVGFYAASTELVDEFWRVGTAAGYRDDGEPGPRPQYGPDYYGGFLLDPDGNSVEAVNNTRDRHGIDHLWIRVADTRATKAFYETIAPFAGIGLGDDTAERVQFVGPGATCSFIAGTPVTENVHLAFPATDDATVDAFHRAATEAGYRDYGGPGERAIYHPGYYGAFVLDPDGNNVEVVNHNR